MSEKYLLLVSYFWNFTLNLTLSRWSIWWIEGHIVDYKVEEYCRTGDLS